MRKYDPHFNLSCIVKICRSHYSYTQKELAELMKVSVNTISKYENQKQWISERNAVALCKVLKIPPKAFVNAIMCPDITYQALEKYLKQFLQ